MRIYWKKRQSFSTAGAARECNGGCLCLGRSPCLGNLPRATACFELSLGVGGKLGVCAPVGARVSRAWVMLRGRCMVRCLQFFP